jgi:PAS domain S-box-containing protein
MSERHAGLELLIAAGDQSFGRAVADAVEATGEAAVTDRVGTATEALAHSVGESVDGVLVGDGLAEPVTVVERLTSDRELPVVVLTDPGNGETVRRAVEAGATDVFPRAETTAQYELVVDRIASERNGSSSPPEAESRDQPYREVFERASDGMVIHDPETGEIVDANDRYCEMTGFSREELVGSTVGLVTADDPAYSAERAEELIRRAREEGSLLFEWRNKHRDGSIVPVEVHLTLVELLGNERVLASVRDITERKRREQEYEQIFNRVQDAITVHDPETGEMVNVNDTFCELLGYDRETILEMGTTGISVEEEGYTEEYAEAVIAEVADEGQKGPYEWMVETKDGDRRVTEVVATKGELGGEERIISSNRDITERKRREREYEQIFNMAGDGIIIHDPESGEILDANQQVADLLGYDRQAFFDQPMSEFQATDEGVSGQQAREKIRKSAETGGQEFEWPLEASDGETIWVRARHETGRIDGEQRVVALLQDITERRRREQEFQQVFNSVNDIIAVHDGDTGELINVNRRMCELTGYDKETILERGAEGLVRDHPEQDYAPEDIPGIIERVMRGEEVQPYEQVLETSDGEAIWVEVNPTRALIGGEARFVAISRDITERRRRKREYEQIFNGVKDSIAVWDPETLELLDVNEAYLEMFGYESRSELREQGVSGLSITEEGYTEQRGREIHQRVAESGEPETVEWQGETRDGERVWTEVKVTPAVIGGEQRTVSIQRDITERKRREQMVRSLHDATERLQKAETVTQTCQTTVEVARDALNLPLAAFWLHRETDDGPALEPVAETAAVEGLDPLWFRPGDETYEAFREGAVRVHDPSEQFPENPLDASIALPIGDHGLLAAGKVGVEEYDEFVVDAARTLAGHVRTALDRVERGQAVRKSERRFRLIAERIDEVIYLTEPDFSEMLYVNPAYEEVYGQPVETLYDDATAFLDVIDERDREPFESDFEAMLADIAAGDPEDSYEFEFRVRRPGGEVRWVHASGYAVELSGENPRFVGIVEDITERKRREQRLEVFNRILRHNLRNQVDVIRSHAEVLADQGTDDHADRIIAAVDELAAMGTRARQTDRIMSMGEAPCVVDLSEVLHETIEEMAPGHDDVRVTTESPERPVLTTSEDAVSIAVENTVENALDHAASAVTVAIEDADGGYRVVVDDDGPGIPKEELVPIETGTETNLRHGRGLGLWQLRWSVDKLNGELSFDTTDGTTVRITIPDRGESN